MKTVLYDGPEYVHLFGAQPDPEFRTAPTLLVLHGTGGDEEELSPLARRLCPKANILSPRGDVVERGNKRFFNRFEDGTFDQADISMRTEAMARFITLAADKYGFDPAKVVIVGYSNGANMGASVLFRHSRLIAGAVLLHALPPYKPEPLPNLAGKPILTSAGLFDPIVVPDRSRRLVQILKDCGAEVADHWFDAGHGIIPEEIAAIASWFRKLNLP